MQSHGRDEVAVDLAHQVRVFFVDREVEDKETTPRIADNCPLKVAELLQGGHVADKSSVVPKNILKTRHKGVRISPFVAEVDKLLKPEVGGMARRIPVKISQCKISHANIDNIIK